MNDIQIRRPQFRPAHPGRRQSFSTCNDPNNVRLDRWQTFRLFLMPFCVSSFAALVKDDGFILIFSPRWEELAIAAALCAVLCGIVWVLRRFWSAVA